MKTPFGPDRWSSDVEFGADMHEFGEFETGLAQLESGFGEFEAIQLKSAAKITCPNYERGEIDKSRTEAGHLSSDVIEHARGLLIADFGVGWRSPKASVKKESALKKWLNNIIAVARANPSTKIRITGFSDCVGTENNNTFLRRGRARRVYQLLYQILGPGAQWKDLQSRITTVAAPGGDYIASNSTVAGRAQNRGVLIESSRTVTFEDHPIVAPDTIERILKRAIEMFQRTDKWDQFNMPIPEYQRQRIYCMLLILNQPGAYDWFVTKNAVDQFDRYPDIIEPELEHVTLYLLPDWVVERRLKRTDREIWRDMVITDNELRAGILLIISLFERRQSAVSRHIQRLRDLVKQYQNNKRSIYWCYR